MLAAPAGGWSASLNGHPLTPLAAPVNGWAQGFRLPPGGGSLSVSRSNVAALKRWWRWRGLAVLVVAGLGLPGSPGGPRRPGADARADRDEPRADGGGRGTRRSSGRRAGRGRERSHDRSRGRRSARRGRRAGAVRRHRGSPPRRAGPGRVAAARRRARGCARWLAAPRRRRRLSRSPRSRGEPGYADEPVSHAEPAWVCRDGLAAAGRAGAQAAERGGPCPDGGLRRP